MKIEKTYKFYAAHRNQYLVGKCRRLHGHRYGLTLVFEVFRDGSLRDGTGATTILFEELDREVQKVIDKLDHRCFVDVEDKLNILQDWAVPIPFPSSAENIAYLLYFMVRNRLALQLCELRLQETDSSIIVYTQDDYERDYRDMSLEPFFSTQPYWKDL